MTFRVIVGLPSRKSTGSMPLEESLVRALTARGHESCLLLTGGDTDEACNPTRQTAFPEGLNCNFLPCSQGDSQGDRWEALERFLEERTPCIYVTGLDGENHLIAPRLSQRIRIIGLIREDSEMEMSWAQRLAPYWNAVVTTGEPIHWKFLCRCPDMAPRVVTIPSPSPIQTGANEGKDPGDAMVDAYLDLFARLDHLSSRGGYQRPRGSIADFSCHGEADRVNHTMPWPDPPAGMRPRALKSGSATPRLEDHRILVAATPGMISGVDVFAARLVRSLRSRGLDARLHGRRKAGDSGPLDLPGDLPFDEFRPTDHRDYGGWPNAWRSLASHLDRLGPCIYLPNYDFDYSCVAPILPDSVRVLGIAHSDDPMHYEHLARIGHACDALVGVSRAITGHLAGLLPGMENRLQTIPYGIPLEDLPDPASRPEHPPGAPLRVIFTGRLVRQQKRAMDLARIARELERRGVSFEMIIVGDGNLRSEMERAVHDLVFRRKVWFTGSQPNADVLSLLPESDAYLLPSSFEGLSVGMLEAMSRGVVPVVSDIRSGVPDAVRHGENGLIAPVGDISRFADHLEGLWKQPELIRRLGAKSARSVREEFGTDLMAERYVEVFRRILEDPLSRPCGPVAPPYHLREEILWSTWASRVASDPLASIRRVFSRICGHPHPAFLSD